MQSLKTAIFENKKYWPDEGLKSGKYENWAPYISTWKNNLDMLTTKTVQIGCDTFPNELVWFHIEAKPIWDKIQKHGKHAVIF